jgi:hypothetical protein
MDYINNKGEKIGSLTVKTCRPARLSARLPKFWCSFRFDTRVAGLPSSVS